MSLPTPALFVNALIRRLTGAVGEVAVSDFQAGIFLPCSGHSRLAARRARIE